MDWKWGERKKNHSTIYMYVYNLSPSLKTHNCFSAVFFHHWLACNQMKTLPHNRSTPCWLKSGSSDSVMRPSVGLHECAELGNRLVSREAMGDRGKQGHPHSNYMSYLSQLYQDGCGGNAVEGPPQSHIAWGLEAHFWVSGTHWSSKINNINPICNLHDFYVNQMYIFIAPWKSKGIIVIITIIISSTLLSLSVICLQHMRLLDRTLVYWDKMPLPSFEETARS